MCKQLKVKHDSILNSVGQGPGLSFSPWSPIPGTGYVLDKRCWKSRKQPSWQPSELAVDGTLPPVILLASPTVSGGSFAIPQQLLRQELTTARLCVDLSAPPVPLPSPHTHQEHLWLRGRLSWHPHHGWGALDCGKICLLMTHRKWVSGLTLGFVGPLRTRWSPGSGIPALNLQSLRATLGTPARGAPDRWPLWILPHSQPDPKHSGLCSSSRASTCSEEELSSQSFAGWEQWSDTEWCFLKAP